MLALSGRPPRPRPARHSALAAAALLAAGIGALALSNRDRPPLLIVGLVATILGCLLIGPLAIRTFTAVAGRVPVAPRLALRDLARYQARSGAALAAVTLALGIAVAAVIVASAEEAKRANRAPALSDRQIRVYLGASEIKGFTPVDATAQLGTMAASVQALAAQLDRAAVTPLRKVVPHAAAPFVIGQTRVYPSVQLTRRDPSSRERFRSEGPLYVATAEVLRYLGIDPADVADGTDFLVDRRLATANLVLPKFTTRQEFAISHVQRFDFSRHLLGSDSAGEEDPKPPAFITLNGLRRLGWEQIPAGWLVESSSALTGSQIADARERAAGAGLSIETQGERYSLATAKLIWTAVGAFLALAILALSVGLIRSESAGDLRTLTATGATSRIRRTLTATTAGALALLGALLGVAGAYVVLVALYYDDLGYLRDVPALYLAFALVGIPLAAAAAGWLLAGREPPAIARTAID
jgi:putative ABC transport system permease protein